METMGKDGFEIMVNAIKLVVIFLMMVQVVPILVWVERRGSAFIQNRFGPNRIGPMGLLQLLADAVKFLFKEDFFPEKGVRFMYYAAPVAALIPATLAFASIPLGAPIQIEAFELFGNAYGPYTFLVQGYEVGVGIVFILAVSSLAVYSVLMAGWGSSNKYSLMGAMRASAQTISYELALGLAIVGVILLYGTFSLTDMVAQQQGALAFRFLGNDVSLSFLPNWGIFYQPLGAILFYAATFAESNRTPFDLPEGEAELVAGFHTEYGGFKFNLFFIGEYGHMLVASGLMVTFFFGGYQLPFVTPQEVLGWIQAHVASGNLAAILNGLFHHVVFLAKVAVFLWIFIHVRWTLPRFRYDQLMELGWKTMLPWALANTIMTAIIIFIAHS